MAEWSVLQTGKHGDSSTIPAGVKTFFGGINSLKQYIAYRFEFNLKLNFFLKFEILFGPRVPGNR